jgi:hypothetical protein
VFDGSARRLHVEQAMSARRATCSVLLLLPLAGCATSFELKNPIAKPPNNEARLAAQEAVGDYSTDLQPRDVPLTAVIDRDAKTVRVINPTDTAYHGVRIWLNQQHVAWVNELPPRRVVHVAQDIFADAANSRLSLTTENIKVVEMQANGEIYRLHGPAMEPSERDGPKGRGFELAFPPPAKK